LEPEFSFKTRIIQIDDERIQRVALGNIKMIKNEHIIYSRQYVGRRTQDYWKLGALAIELDEIQFADPMVYHESGQRIGRHFLSSKGTRLFPL
jgi:hypothetical protein